MNDYNKRVLKNVLEDFREENDKMFLAEIEEAANNPMFANTKDTDDKFYKSLNSFSKKKNKKILFRVASIILALVLGAVATTLSVKSFREKLWDFIFNSKNNSYSIMVASENSFEHKLSEYQGKYVPTWIPEGYEISSIENDDNYNIINFSGPSETSLSYCEYSTSINAKLLIDKENCDTYKVESINGSDIIFASKDGFSYLLITKRDTVIHITCNNTSFDFYGFSAHIEEK